MERMTREHVETRCENLNRRLESRGSIIRYGVQSRNGATALDRYHVGSPNPVALVTIGTKREIADALHWMMVALDDASFTG